MLINFGVLLASDRVTPYLSEATVQLLEIVLGIFLGALAIQLVINGLADVGIINSSGAQTDDLTTNRRLCKEKRTLVTDKSYDTRIGRLTFTHDFANGYPTKETYQKLYDEMDFQRACQLYLWAIPIVSFAQWQFAYNMQLGAENGQIVYLESYDDKLGGLTFNVTTPYALPFIDLEKEGPFVAEIPEGEIRGAAHDRWQIGITQITEPGKYLFVGPGQEIPSEAVRAGFKPHHSPTNNLLLGIRLMPESSEDRLVLLEQLTIYPYSEKDNPQPRWLYPTGWETLAGHRSPRHGALGPPGRHPKPRAGFRARSLVYGHAQATRYRKRQVLQPR